MVVMAMVHYKERSIIMNDVKVRLPIINLGGKARVIKYDMNAFEELENMYGTIDTALADLATGSMGAVKKVLWAGLIHANVELDKITGEIDHYTLSKYQVGSWMTPEMLEEIYTVMDEALGVSLPDSEEESEKNEVVSTDEVQTATVVYTEEELKANEAEEKNV